MIDLADLGNLLDCRSGCSGCNSFMFRGVNFVNRLKLHASSSLILKYIFHALSRHMMLRLRIRICFDFELISMN